MRLVKSQALKLACLMGMGAILNGCGAASAIEIPDSLKAPCVSTVDVSNAETLGDLSSAIIQGDADLRVCSIQKDAVTAIAESGRRSWWPF